MQPKGRKMWRFWSESSALWRMSNLFSLLFPCVWPHTYPAPANIPSAIRYWASILHQRANKREGKGNEKCEQMGILCKWGYFKRHMGWRKESGLKGTRKAARWITRNKWRDRWMEETEDLQMDKNASANRHVAESQGRSPHRCGFNEPPVARLVRWVNYLNASVLILFPYVSCTPGAISDLQSTTCHKINPFSRGHICSTSPTHTPVLISDAWICMLWCCLQVLRLFSVCLFL